MPPVFLARSTRVLAVLVLALFALGAEAANVRAWLDRTTLHLGETVTLNVESTDANAREPDFSALARDFTLSATQLSRQVSMINGLTSAKTLWAVGLEPRRVGRFTIPALAVGTETTAPIEVEVKNAAPAPQAGGDAFIEFNVEPADPYVQQQTRGTVKFHFAVDLANGNLSDPQADGLLVQRLGQDKTYESTLGNRRYRVIERHYALTPQRSGDIEIAPLLFRGSAIDNGDPAGFFGRGRTLSVRSDAVHLSVRPKPAEWTEGPWLPATSVLLKDETELPDEVRVGEPVTRTIRLQVQGAGFEQVPELTMAAPDGAEIYPDKADARTRDDGQWLFGERERKFALVPNRAGTLVVPGYTLRWFNTATHQIETTELPAKTITVRGAPGSAATANTRSSVATANGDGAASGTVLSTPSQPGASAPTELGATPTVIDKVKTRERKWKTLAIALLLLWLATIGAWWASRRGSIGISPKPVAAADQSAAAFVHRDAFLRAAARGELAAAERALVAWARAEKPELRNVGEIAAALTDAAQVQALARLQRARYAGADASGLGPTLEKAFKPGFGWRAAAATDRPRSPLPALYP